MSPTPITTEERVFTITNPATGEEAGRFTLMDKAMVNAAVERARQMFPTWSAGTFEERRRILKNAASILGENAADYASVIVKETGKTRIDALLADIATTGELLKFYAKNLKKYLKPARVPGNIFLPGRRGYYMFEPKGVIGIVSPWNYPFALAAGPVISAVAAGNTVVLKPSSQTTASGMMIKEILEKAGLPVGVIEVVTGNGAETGDLLVEHPGLDMVFFTGSTEVGRRVYMKAAQNLKPVIMELGGKDVAIVTRNADISRAAHAITWGAFTNSGQTCTSIELALVERSVYDSFLKKVLEITSSLKSGPGEGEIGAMTTAEQLRKVEDQVADAILKGAKALTGGQRAPNLNGRYYPPTVLTGVNPGMKLMKEETFGPLLPIIPYDDINEALMIANDTPYGLSGAVFSKDLAEARSIAKRLQTGSVNINDAVLTFAMSSLPFGGVKNSGVGMYHGKMGLQAFTNVKSITEFNWNLKKEFYHYPMIPGIGAALEKLLVSLLSGSRAKRIRALARTFPIVKSMIRGGNGRTS